MTSLIKANTLKIVLRHAKEFTRKMVTSYWHKNTFSIKCKKTELSPMESIEKNINKYLCDDCKNKCEKCMSLEIIEYNNYIEYKCLNYNRKEYSSTK